MDKKTFFRRLKFYAFGFLLGLIMVNFMFDGRTICKMPGTIKREELKKQDKEFTATAFCNLECLQLDTSDLQLIFDGGKVNYDLSNPQAEPCPLYMLTGKAKDYKIGVLCADCDTITKVIKVSLREGEQDCTCP